RVEPHNLRLDECGPCAVPHRIDHRRKRLIQVLKPCTVQVERRHAEALRDAMYLRPCLAGLRYADRVTVVLDREQDRQFLARSPVQRLEKLAFTGSAFTG